MKGISKICAAAIVAMTILSFTNLFGLNIAGLAVFIGLIGFFVNKAVQKQPFAGSGLELRAAGSALKEKSVRLWITLPLIMDVVSMALGRLFLPGYAEYVSSRVSAFVSLNNIVLAALQMIVLALGEEIAWRAFFQKQAAKILPLPAVLVFSSLLFALGHVSGGGAAIVAFDVFFVFVNSILYGIIFEKTGNAWVSALSHYAANLFSVLILL